MGKQSESTPFKENFNLSKKTKGTNSASRTSSDRENWEIGFQNSRSDLLKQVGNRRKSNHTFYSYSRKFITVLNYIFCILGIICAWGAIDSLVQVISGRQVYLSLACYSIILLLALVFLILYIYYLDRDYRPCDFF
ncbi:hypothetical protein C922_04988 [Plasmodium inui San Antonio 1]|uniref:Uncharacterized protein n=1 Tax=Plasmodium inui San Antonio 1 TaxID=1237626 RepID=W6ZV44_9APIC|nr:hypothetical protein C922_04988 [Plasmodium inui San Antonio 1]EUD64642.1 hypothetical protein C922_04988 [Plasmodium inui San Antonio 1]